jgi:amino acid transporter
VLNNTNRINVLLTLFALGCAFGAFPFITQIRAVAIVFVLFLVSASLQAYLLKSWKVETASKLDAFNHSSILALFSVLTSFSFAMIAFGVGCWIIGGSTLTFISVGTVSCALAVGLSLYLGWPRPNSSVTQLRNQLY